jgi:hypothetical protein
MLEFRIGINECSFGSRIAAARCHVANLGRASSCLGVDGLMKGALYSGLSTSEWDGSQGKYYTGGGTVRAVGGLAVTLLTEGVGSAIMKDGKPAGNEASGKGVFKFASGTLAELSGKADRWQAKPAGFGRFTLEIMADDEPSTVGTSQK